MNFIEDLYYGRIAPHEKGFYENEEYKAAARKLDKSMIKLKETLSEESIELFDKFWDNVCTFTIISEFENFRMGFRLGGGLIRDIF